jgi:hypothetical protein
MNNYTESQIKLAGLVQPESGAREFEQGLDLQGEGIRVLQNDRTIFEENTGDCCEDLQTCELAFNACEAERIALEEENQELEEENEELKKIVDGTPGLCTSISYQIVNKQNFVSGSICIEKSATKVTRMVGTLTAQSYTGPSNGSGNGGVNSYWGENGIKGSSTGIGGTGVSIQWDQVETYTNTNSFDISPNKTIPSSADSILFYYALENTFAGVIYLT